MDVKSYARFKPGPMDNRQPLRSTVLEPPYIVLRRFETRLSMPGVMERPRVDVNSVLVCVKIVAGKSRDSLASVPPFNVCLQQINSEAPLLARFDNLHCISNPLREIHGLSLLSDHDKTIFCYTGDDRTRHTVPLSTFSRNNQIAEWKGKIYTGELPAQAPCDCDTLENKCQGALHGPELYVVLKRNHDIQQFIPPNNIDSAKKTTIEDLEAIIRRKDIELRQLKIQVANCRCNNKHKDLEKDKHELVKENDNVNKQNKDLELRVANPTLETSNICEKRKRISSNEPVAQDEPRCNRRYAEYKERMKAREKRYRAQRGLDRP